MTRVNPVPAAFAACLSLAAVPAAALFAPEEAWDSGARGLGLGGAYAGLAQGPSAGAWNPSGLAWEQRASLEASGGALAGGGSSTGLRAQLPGIHGAAFGLGWLDSRPKALGNPTEGRLSGQAALHLDPAHSVAAGLGLNYRWASFGGQSWAGRSLDLGLLARLNRPKGRPLALGLVLGDLGAASREAAGEERREASRISAGLSWAYGTDGLLLADLSAWDRGRGGPALRMGTEYAFSRRRLFLRAGYGRDPADSRWSLGLGWRGKDWGLDYGLALPSGGGSRHQVSLAYLLGPLSIQSEAPFWGGSSEALSKELEERLLLLRQAQADLNSRADASLAQTRKLTDKIAALEREVLALQTESRRAPAPQRKERKRQGPEPARKAQEELAQGKALFDQAKYKEAYEAYGRAYDADPKDEGARQGILDCLAKIPREELYPQEYLDLYNQGIGFNTQGAFEEEIRVWKQFLSVYPKDLRVEGFLKEAEERLKRIKGGA